MRNPFPKIGKVIKYDLKHSSKRLLPLYGVLLILGLLVGIFISPDRFNLWDSEFYTLGSRDFITISLIIAYAIFSCVAEVMTIVAIARRFKQSMLEEEAYMNLSLPVTMGEHLWGKFITSFIWLFCCGFVNLISGIFCLIRLDLPTFDRPANATSFLSDAGNCPKSATESINLGGAANSLLMFWMDAPSFSAII